MNLTSKPCILAIQLFIYLHLFNILFRKCDLKKCISESGIWKSFVGCGHLYHLQCIVPNISVCKICQDELISAMDLLAKKANKAVHENAAVVYDEDDDIDKQTSDDGDYFDDNVVSEDYVNEESVNALNATICQWKLAAAPLS